MAAGDGDDVATVANAHAYVNNVINRVLSGRTSTPHRPGADMDVYIFALFNENQKGDGPDDIEAHYGLFYPDYGLFYRELVRGERRGRGRAAAGGAGLRVRARRGLRRHPARGGVLRAQHQAHARLVRVQQLLPAQRPGQRGV